MEWMAEMDNGVLHNVIWTINMVSIVSLSIYRWVCAFFNDNIGVSIGWVSCLSRTYVRVDGDITLNAEPISYDIYAVQ